MYTFDDMRSDIDEARKLDRERGDRARSFERDMKGTFQQNADLQRQIHGTWRDRALEERALRGTFDQNAALRREMEGPWADRNKAENWRANLASNTQIRGQDLAAQTARYGTDANMIDNSAQRSFMDRIYRMQDETQRGSQESLGKDRRLKIYSDAWLNLQDDAFNAFPEDEVKRAQYIQQGRRQLDQLFPEFGKPKPPLPGGLEFGGSTPVEQTRQPDASMDGLTRRVMQMYNLPQSNATDNARTVLNGDQRPFRRPIPKQEYPGFNGWDEVRRRTGGF